MKWVTLLLFFYFVVPKVNSIHDHSKVLNFYKIFNIKEFKSQKTYSSNNELCDQDLMVFHQSLERNEQWAVRFADTWAKVQAGFLSENTINIGDFDSCVRFQHNHMPNRIFEGQHCLVPLSALPDSTLDADRTDLGLKNLANFFRTNGVVTINGFCFPKTCSATRAVKFLNEEILSKNDLIAFGARCRDLDMQLEPIDYFAISVFTIIGIIFISSTIYDIIQSKSDKSEPIKLLASFSAYTNGYKLFDVAKVKSPSSINCLHGLRAMSIFWIILGHRIHLQFPWGNPKDYRAFMNNRIISMPLHTHHLAVDTFLVMGALLMTWSTLKDCEKNQLNILRMIWRRYLRYTPVLAALVFGAASIFRFTLNGPLYLDMLRDNCINNWWWALLHIQNYLPESEMCLNHSWYLSIDFQLFLISPFIIYLIHKFGKKCVVVPGVLCFGTMIYIFSIAMVLNIKMPQLASGDGDDPDYSQFIYFPTQSRAGPWFIGIILGYFLYVKRGEKIVVNKFFNALMWIASLSTLCTVAFLSFAFSISTREISTASHASFMTLQRNLWAVAICWIVFACQNLKTGGIIRWFLSLPQWQPISRMGLSMYLVSATYQVLTILNQRVPLYMNFWQLIPIYLSDVAITIILSIIFYLGFEAPPLIIEDYVYKKIKNKPE